LPSRETAKQASKAAAAAAGQFSGRIARVNGLNELKSHYAVKRFEIFGLRGGGGRRVEPSSGYLPTISKINEFESF